MGLIISIVNNKGGCGKTTTTCNLADALSRKDKRVLVVDIDSQCNTTSIMIPQGIPIRKSLYDILNPEENNTQIDIRNFFYQTDSRKVMILPNISETANLEPSMIMNAPDSFFRLRNSIRDYAIKEFDFTIIDNPPNMGSFVLCSLYASDFVIVPVKAGSAFSVEGLYKATRLINEIKEKGNPDLKFLRLLVNGIDKRTAISKTLVDMIQQNFEKHQIFKTAISVNTVFEKAESAGKTIFQYDGAAPGARAFRELANEIISILGGGRGHEKEDKSG